MNTVSAQLKDFYGRALLSLISIPFLFQLIIYTDPTVWAMAVIVYCIMLQMVMVCIGEESIWLFVIIIILSLFIGQEGFNICPATENIERYEPMPRIYSA